MRRKRDWLIWMIFCVTAFFGCTEVSENTFSEPNVDLASPNFMVYGHDEYSIDLMWDYVAKAESYEVYRDDVLLKNLNAVSYRDEDLIPGKSYKYKVRAIAGSSKGPFSVERSAKCLAKPSKPEISTIEIISPEEFKVVWNTVLGAEFYRLFRNDSLLTEIDDTVYVDRDLQKGKKYSYKLFAVNSNGESLVSEARELITPKTPEKPQNFMVEFDENRKIFLSWDYEEGVQKYYIYRNNGYIGSTKDAFYLDNRYIPGTEYLYKVKAKNDIGSSGFSDAVFFLALLPPTKPALSIIDYVDIKIVWSDVKGAVRYKVYRGESLLAVTDKKIYEGKQIDFLDTTVGELQTKVYQVSCVNEEGVESQKSPKVSVTTYAFPAHKVYYNSNGGTGLVEDGNSYKKGSSVVVKSADGLSKKASSFSHWSNLADGSGDAIYPGFEIKMGSRDTTLYAIWNWNKYAVSYDANGGVGTVPETQTGVYDQVISLQPKGDLTKQGHRFVGWEDRSGNSVLIYPAESAYKFGDFYLTLYASWEKNSYTISFDSKGGTAVGYVVQLYGSDLVLPADPTKTGFDFGGWFLDADCSTPVVEPYKVEENLTFYAKWIPKDYQISFYVNGGSSINSLPRKFGDAVGVLPEPVRTGYTFVGWFNSAFLENLVQSSDVVENNLTVYAKWAINSYTVNFDSNGGTAVTALSKNYSEQIASLGASEKERYNFEGWYLDAGLSEKVELPYVVEENATFFAKWSKMRFTLSYNANEASSGSCPSASVQDFDLAHTVADYGDLAKKGYSIESWNSQNDGAGNKYFPGDKIVITKNTTLFLIFRINKYKLSFDVDGGDEIAEVVQDFGTSCVLPSPIKTGYNFVRWSTEASGAGSVYSAGENFVFSDKDVVLYANWISKNFVVTFDAKGGNCGVESTVVAYNSIIGNLPEPTKAGYDFGGWYAEESYLSEVEADFVVTKNLIVYAKWNPKFYEMIFDGNGASSQTVSGKYLNNILVPNAPNRVGYDFVSWSENQDGSGSFCNQGDLVAVPLGGAKYFAQWRAKSYTVSFDARGGSSSYEVTKNYGEQIGSFSSPSYTNHIFEGWFTDSTTFSTQVVAPYTVSGDAKFFAKWRKEKFVLSYAKNDADSGEPPASQSLDFDQKFIVKDAGSLSKTGFSFAGWDTKADGSGVRYQQGEQLYLSSNLTLYAIFDVNSYTLSFDAQGGDALAAVKQNFGSSYTLGSASKLGYTFNSWNTKSDGTGARYNAGATYIFAAEDITLYAIWGVNSYTVSFDPKGGSASQNYREVEYNQSVGQLPSAARDGYDFVGWFLEPECVNQVSADYKVKSDVEFYAKWTQKRYSVLFDGNGNGWSNSFEADYLSEVVVPAQQSWAGYIFKSWNTKQDGSGVRYNSGEKIAVPLGGISLYAQWEAIFYNLSYDKNGANLGSAPVDNSSYTIGQNATVLGASSLGKTGHSFVGWDTISAGSGQFQANDKVVFGAKNITLFAIWSVNKYSLSYELNGGSGSLPNAENYDYAQNVGIDDGSGISRVGYSFAGWNTAQDGSGESFSGEISMPAKDLKLYAIWQIKRYTLSYDGNGNSSGAAPSAVVDDYNSYVVVAGASSLQKQGYSFVGWNSKADGTGSDFVEGDGFSLSQDITFYAVWQINFYEISFVENGGSALSSVQKLYDTQITTAPLSVKTGYSLQWCADIALSSPIVFPYSVTADAVWYAKWSPKIYSLVYDKNGGDGTMPVQTFEFLQTKNLSANSFSKIGHAFKNWNTKADGSGASYGDMASYQMNTTGASLYAMWSVNSYKVSFKEADGALIFDSVKQFGLALTLPDYAKEGYDFGGWYDDVSFSGEAVSSYVVGASDDVLYAKLTPKTFVLSYDLNSGQGDVPSSEDVVYGSNFVAKSSDGLSKLGYSFNGWNSKADGSGMQYSQGVSYPIPAKDLRLFAQWKEEGKSVVYSANGADGSVPIDNKGYMQGDLATVKSPTNLSRRGYNFTEWNTNSAGSGASYSPGSSVPISETDITLYAIWDKIDYSVTYFAGSGQGVSGSVPTDLSAYNIGDKIVVKGSGSLAKEGYSFIGWNTSENGDGSDYSENDEIAVDTLDVRLYAQWSINSYLLEYYLNDGSGNLFSSFNHEFDSEVGLLSGAGLSRVGYDFAGWNTQADTLGADYAEDFRMPASEVKLFAKWRKKSFAITYYDNGKTEGAAPVASRGLYQEDVAVADSGTLVRTGYRFAGWSASQNASEVSYAIGSTVNLEHDLALYPVWQINSYKLTYYDNDGTSAKTEVIAEYKSVQNLKDGSKISYAGHKFLKWNTAADGGGIDYTLGFTMPAEDLELYAIWQAINYRVTYDANGAQGAGPEDAADYTIGQKAVVLGEAGLAKAGHTFAGWNSKADTTGVNYSPGDELEVSSDTTLFAKWRIKFYLTAFQEADGSTLLPSKTEVYNSVISLQNPAEKYGYEFAGWYLESDFSGNKLNEASFLVSKNDTLYAKWDTLSFTVTFSWNSAVPNQLITKNYKEFIEESPVGDKIGYSFENWYETADFAGNSVSFPYEIVKNQTLYAKWKIDSFLVEFKDENADGGYQVYSFKKPYQSSVTPPNLEKKGFDFVGWYVAADYSSPKVDFASYKVGAENAEFFAKWEIKQFSLGYDGNGNTGGSAPFGSVYDYGTKVLVADKGDLSYFGKYFVGWYDARDADENILTRENSDSVLIDTSVVLAAKWENENYSVTYYANSEVGVSGSVPVDADAYNYGDEYLVLSKGDLAKVGHKFVGWNTAVDGSGATYAEGSAFYIVADAEFYAVWQVEKYSLSYNVNGGDGDVPAAENYDYDADVAISSGSGISKVGYNFVCWNTKADGSGENYSSDFKMVAKDLALYAKWEKKSYTVSYHADGSTAGAAPSDSSGLFMEKVKIAGGSDLVRTGFSFAGWNSTPEKEIVEYSPLQEINLVQNLDLYPVWIRQNYLLTYYYNDGSGEKEEISHPYGALVTLKNGGTIHRDGYIFNSWNTEADGKGDAQSADFTMPAGNFSLYAIWDTIDYSLTYSANGAASGEAPVDSKEYHFGDSAEVAGNTGGMLKPGYTFVGWNSLADTTGDNYLAGFKIRVVSDTTIYAKWHINSYRIEFRLDEADYGDSVKKFSQFLELPKPVRAHYYFDGWYQTTGYSGDKFTETLVVTEDDTLFGRMLKRSYEVNYQVLKPDGSTIDSALTKEYEQFADFPVVSLANHHLDGWYSAADFSGEKLTDAVQVVADTTYYARFLIDSYLVKIVIEDVDGSKQELDSLKAAGSELFFPNFAAEGKSLHGWWQNSDYTIGKIDAPKMTVLAPDTLFGYWETDSFLVNYYYDFEGATSKEDTLVAYGESLIAPSPSEEYYTLDAWYSDVSYEAAKKIDFDDYKVVAADTLYARWLPKVYDIYRFDGEQILDTLQGDYNTSLQLTPIAKENYDFEGWYFAPSLSPDQKIASEQLVVQGVDSLFGKWTLKNYQLSYFSDKQTAGEPPIAASYPYGEKVAVSSRGSLERSDYVFAGWCFDSAGAGDTLSWDKKDSIFILSDTTLYAMWTPETFQISYNSNGGTGLQVDNSAYVKNDLATVKDAGDLAKTGYIFDGWNTKADGTGAVYQANDQISVSGNVVLYAMWKVWVENLSNLMSETQFNAWFPSRNTGTPADILDKNLFNYSSFEQAASKYPKFLGEGSQEDKKRELAAFLAQSAKETGGSSIDYIQGYYFPKEQNPLSDYVQNSVEYPAVAGKAYFGRGPLQLSWNGNYGQASQAIYGDKSVLLENPDKLFEDPVAFWESAIWFWMTPQGKKPSCHAAIIGGWDAPTSLSKKEQVYNRLFVGYGLTINIINGELEAGNAENNPTRVADADAKVESRVGFYNHFCANLGVEPGENTDCENAYPFNNLQVLPDGYGFPIEGEIVDYSSEPFQGFPAELYKSSDNSLVSSAISDKNGEFVLNAEVGDYYLKLDLSKFEVYKADFSHQYKGDENIPVEVIEGVARLPKLAVSYIGPALKITGNVATSAGTPVAGVVVEASGDFAQSVQTDAAGNYAFDDVTAGASVVISCAKDGYSIESKSGESPFVVDIVRDENVDFVATNFAKPNIVADKIFTYFYDGEFLASEEISMGVGFNSGAIYDFVSGGAKAFAGQSGKEIYTDAKNFNGDYLTYGRISASGGEYDYKYFVNSHKLSSGLKVESEDVILPFYSDASVNKAITVRARNSVTWQDLAGVTIKVTDASGNSYGGLTDANGVAIVNGLSNGRNYTVEALQPGAEFYPAKQYLQFNEFADLQVFGAVSGDYAILSFVVNGGSAVEPITGASPYTVASLPTPSKANRVFDGWYLDNGLYNPVILPLTISQSKTVYAKWDYVRRNIRFDVNGGQEIADMQVIKDSLMESPEAVRQGYDLEGWYSDASLSTKISFPFAPTGDMTMYAKWAAKSYSLNYYANGGSGTVPPDGNYAFDQEVVLPAAAGLSKSGYNFVGWNTKNDGSGINLMPGESFRMASNTSLYANWQQINASVAGKMVAGYWYGGNLGVVWDDGTSVQSVDVPFSDFANPSSPAYEYDVVCVAFAIPQTNGSSVASFAAPAGFSKATVQAAQATGKKVLIAVGDTTQGLHFSIANSSEKDAFVASLKTIIGNYGFDGVEIFVQARLADNQVLVDNYSYLDEACAELVDYYRGGSDPDFMFTASPEIPMCKAPNFYYGWLNDEEIKSRIDYVAPKLYNQRSWAVNVGGSEISVDNTSFADFAVACTRAFTGEDANYPSYDLDKFVVNIAANKYAADAISEDESPMRGYALDESQLKRVWNNLGSLNKKPRGFAAWSVDWDAKGSWEFVESATQAIVEEVHFGFATGKEMLEVYYNFEAQDALELINAFGTGGNAKMEIVSGKLPQGMSMSYNGVISGKSTELGVHKIKVKASYSSYEDYYDYEVRVLNIPAWVSSSKMIEVGGYVHHDGKIYRGLAGNMTNEPGVVDWAWEYVTDYVAPSNRVLYNVNGGIGSQEDATIYASGQTVTVKNQNDMSKEGYVFAGWNTSPDGSGTSYGVGSTFTFDQPIVLYAMWEKI